jgi:hypothetical protein
MVQKMTSRFHLFALLGMMLVFTAMSAAPSLAQAELYVIESSAAAIKVGSRFAPSDSISIPAGSHIRAVLPSGKTQTIKGPYNGSVADLTKGQAVNAGVMAWVRNILQTGGATEATAGATRSIGREAPKYQVGFSWEIVPVGVNGDICIRKGGRLQLGRARPVHPERVIIIDAAGGAQGEAKWEAGSEVAAWPENLAPKANGTYYLLVQDRPRRQITLRVLDKLPADDDVLAELQARNCKFQFEVWLSQNLEAKKGS